MKKHAHILVFLFLTGTGFGQNYHTSWFTDIYGDNTGHTTCAFLTLPLSAGVMGTGIRGLASDGMADASDIPWYTANTGFAEKNLFAANHLEWFMGLRKEFAGAAFPLLGIGTVGAYTQVFTVGSDPYARDINERPNDLSSVELALGGSFGRSFFDRMLSVGGTVSYIESRLDDIAGRALALSADARITPIDALSSSVYVRNFGTDVTYTTGSEPLPVQTGLSVSWHPMQSVDPEFGLRNRLTVAAGVQKTADEPLAVGLGLEWRPLSYLGVRSGYEYSLGSGPTVAGLSAGCGFYAKNYGMDGAWTYLSPVFGSVWSATIKMELESSSLNSAEDYFRQAQVSFGQGHYNDCIHYAKKAVRRDPNMWKAHALIARAQSEILRGKRLEIALIYTGNERGQFLPPFDPGVTGGLARQASAIAALRDRFPMSISVAAGNIVTMESAEVKAKIAHRYYRYINNDAVCLGDGEFEYGLKDFLALDTGHVQFLCTDGENLGLKRVISKKIVEREGYRIAVIAAVNTPQIAAALRQRRSSLAQEISLELKRMDIRQCNLRVVVLDDTWDNIKSYAPELQDAEVVVCGSIDQYFQTPMKLGSTVAVSAGSNGMFAGCLTLRFDKRKRFLTYDNRLIPLTGEIAPDSVVEKMTKPISAEAELKEQGLGRLDVKKGSTDGVFPFISTRAGTPELYLKIIRKLAEFPLARGITVTGSPLISFEAGKIAFIGSDSASGCRPLYTIDLTGAKRSTIVDSAVVTEAVVSPGGKWIYYTAAPCNDTVTDIFRAMPDSGIRLPVVAWKNSTENGIAFSPDFSEMVFCSNRDGSWQLYLTSPDGEHPLRMTDATANHCRPSFSPDGKFIAYLSDRASLHGSFDLWVFDRTAGKHAQVTREAYAGGYCWLDDSKRIVCSSGLDLSELMVVDVASGVSAKLIRPAAGEKTYREIDPRLIWDGDERKIVYAREYENGEKHLYRTTLDGKKDECLVRSSGSDWLGK